MQPIDRPSTPESPYSSDEEKPEKPKKSQQPVKLWDGRDVAQSPDIFPKITPKILDKLPITVGQLETIENKTKALIHLKIRGLEKQMINDLCKAVEYYRSRLPEKGPWPFIIRYRGERYYRHARLYFFEDQTIRFTFACSGCWNMLRVMSLTQSIDYSSLQVFLFYSCKMKSVEKANREIALCQKFNEIPEALKLERGFHCSDGKGHSKKGLFFESLDLRSLWDIEKDSFEKKLDAAMAILKALAGLHEKGICHFNLRSNHVYLHPSGSGELLAKLIGFCDKEDHVQRGVWIEPKGDIYLAPEILLNRLITVMHLKDPLFPVGPKADVWAAALCIYQIFNSDRGIKIWDKQLLGAPVELLKKIQKHEFLKVESPGPVDQILSQMFCSQQEERITAQNALEQFTNLRSSYDHIS
jgi:serine/threonine protein kinase